MNKNRKNKNIKKNCLNKVLNKVLKNNLLNKLENMIKEEKNIIMMKKILINKNIRIGTIEMEIEIGKEIRIIIEKDIKIITKNEQQKMNL